MTLDALCIHLGVSYETFRQWRSREGFVETVEMVDLIIRNQKFEGACAGLFPHAFIARDIGLADKREVSGVVINFSGDDAEL